MKIKKIKLSDKDKLKAEKSAKRNAMVETGMDRITLTRVFRNKKKYSRKRKFPGRNVDE